MRNRHGRVNVLSNEAIESALRHLEEEERRRDKVKVKLIDVRDGRSARVTRLEIAELHDATPPGSSVAITRADLKTGDALLVRGTVDEIAELFDGQK